MGKSWPAARKADKLKAKRKERGGDVAGGRSRLAAIEARLETARWISSTDAATLLGMSNQQILVAITSGRFAGRRDGGKFLVSTESVKQHRAQQPAD